MTDDPHGPAPTVPGVLVTITHPDDPPQTCTLAEAKRGPRTVRWKCAACPRGGAEKGRWAALAALYAHEPTCPANPAVAAAREAAQRGRRRR